MKKKIIILTLALISALTGFAQESTLTRTLINGKYGWGYPSTYKKDNLGYPLVEVLVIPAVYEESTNVTFSSTYEGLIGVELDSKWGFIDATGATKIPFTYDGAGYFSDGLAPVKLNGKCGFINKNGAVVIPLKFETALSFSDGLSYVEVVGKVGFINKTGAFVIPAKYDIQTNAVYKRCIHCGPVYAFQDGKATVILNGKCGVVDMNGNFTECADEALDSTIFIGVVNAKKDRWGGNPGAAIRGTAKTQMDIKKIMLNDIDMTYITYENNMMYLPFTKLKPGDNVTIKIVYVKGSTFKLNDQLQGFDLGSGQENLVEKPVIQAGPALDSTIFTGKITKYTIMLQSSDSKSDIKKVYLNDTDISYKFQQQQRILINIGEYKLRIGQKATIKIVHAKGSTVKQLDPKGIE
jgi:WG repeat protein